MLVDKDHPPPDDYHWLIYKWVRGVDPWHADAFPPELRYAGTTGERKEGWEGEDWAGNAIVFIADGTIIKEG